MRRGLSDGSSAVQVPHESSSGTALQVMDASAPFIQQRFGFLWGFRTVLQEWDEPSSTERVRRCAERISHFAVWRFQGKGSNPFSIYFAIHIRNPFCRLNSGRVAPAATVGILIDDVPVPACEHRRGLLQVRTPNHPGPAWTQRHPARR